MVFHWSLSDKSPQVSMTLLSILTDLNKAVVWINSTCPLISKFYSPFTEILVIVQSATITVDFTITFILCCFFFTSLVRSRYFFHFLEFLICSMLVRQNLLFD